MIQVAVGDGLKISCLVERLGMVEGLFEVKILSVVCGNLDDCGWAAIRNFAHRHGECEYIMDLDLPGP